MSDPKETRAAYGRATARLRKKYAAEFKDMLNEEYAEAGLTVRKRRSAAEKAADEAAKQAEREQKAAAKRQEKIDKLQSELQELKGDPEFAALAEAIESVTTADQ